MKIGQNSIYALFARSPSFNGNDDVASNNLDNGNEDQRTIAIICEIKEHLFC